MSKKVFDESKSGLPEFIVDDEPELSTDLDLIIDLPIEKEAKKEDKPAEKPLSTVNDIFIMGNKKQLKEPQPLKEPTDTVTSSDLKGVTLEKDQTNIDLEVKPKKEKYANIGKRGRDKKPRKKRVMSDAQKEKLALARQKSLEVRRAKARAKYAEKKKQKEEKKVSEPINIPKPQQDATILNPMSNFDRFCEYMERYEQRKMKKVSNSQDPHPNKIIPTNHKPRPPVVKRDVPKVVNRIHTPAQPPVQQQPKLRQPPKVISHNPGNTSLMDKFNAIRSNNRPGFGHRW